MKTYTFSILLAIALTSCAQNGTNETVTSNETATSNETSVSDGTEKQKEEATIINITQEEFKKTFENKEGLQLLDVRSQEEISEGKIGEAKELDVNDSKFGEKIAGLKYDKSLPVVIYCRSGGRSLKASQIFIDQGFTQVYNLLGGYSNYK